jgi:pimeloyl-ACP methyl ester carboxylesterase
MLRKMAALVAAASLVAVTAAAADAAQQPAPPRPVSYPSIQWTACADVAAVQCGSLRLPVDRAHPHKTFDLAVARRPAADPKRRIGALFLNPGGPGASGVALVKEADEFLTEEMRARFDVVSFDPRGIVGSSPVKCAESMAEKHIEMVAHTPRSAAEFAALTAHNRAHWQDCRRHSGSMIDHYDTLNVIQDMDALRVALGEEKISYLGVSYGTLIGQQYAARYGRHLRAMVIDSAMDHRLSGHALIATAAAGVEEMFHQFVTWCGQTVSCDMHGKDVPRRWDELMIAADRGELYDGAGTLMDADLAIATVGPMLSGLSWPYLAMWINAATVGKPAGAATSGEAYRPPPPSVPLVTSATGVFCEDWDAGLATFADFQRMDRASRAAAPHMRYDSNMRSAMLGCAGSPRPLPLNNPQSTWKPDPAGPVILIANSRYDSKTSLGWAKSLLGQGGSKAVLLTYEGWGHNTYTHSPCMRASIDSYLLGEKTPAAGATCPAPATGPVEPSPDGDGSDTSEQASTADRGVW